MCFSRVGGAVFSLKYPRSAMSASSRARSGLEVEEDIVLAEVSEKTDEALEGGRESGRLKDSVKAGVDGKGGVQMVQSAWVDIVSFWFLQRNEDRLLPRFPRAVHTINTFSTTTAGLVGLVGLVGWMGN